MRCSSCSTSSWRVSAFADELRPAYLSIRETRPDEFSVLWKVPALGDKRLGLYLQLPDTCVTEVRAGPLDRERFL